MGGKYVAPRAGASLTDELEAVAEGLRRLGDGHARAVVVHCSQEPGWDPDGLFVSWLGRPELHTDAADTKESPVAGPSE